VRAILNCRWREPLSSLFPSLFYLSHVKPRLPPFTCQCVYNSELSAPGQRGEPDELPHSCQHGGPDLKGDRTGPDGTGPARAGVWICVCVCVCVDDRASASLSVWEAPLPSTGLVSRGLTALPLCPSLHFSALISVTFASEIYATESLTDAARRGEERDKTSCSSPDPLQGAAV